MLKKEDFKWHEHRANNISTNPLTEWYCIVDVGNHARKYGIIPQYPEKDGITYPNEDPEYYVLFEASGNKATDEEKEEFHYKHAHFDDYLFGRESFIRVYKTMEEAKDQAYLQYKAIFGFVLAHITDDVEAATKEHISV